MSSHYIRLPLEHAFNVRDLGGYAASSGRVTRWRTLLRADDLYELAPAEVDFLVEYGVRAVVDLRTPKEIAQRPDPFADHGDVRYHHLPVGPDELVDPSRLLQMSSPTLLQEFYVAMLAEHGDRIAAAVNLIADAPDATLFHCSAGKDRTGLIAMLLLGVAGVRESDIVSNYAASYEHLMENPQIRAYLSQVPAVLMESAPATIRAAMNFISDKYGSYADYLVASGVNRGSVERLAERMSEPAQHSIVQAR